jgi:hypothetical protein
MPCRALAAFALAALLSPACTQAGAPAGPEGRLALGVAPLSLPLLTDACYDLAVTNEAGDAVWSRSGLCASQYGSPSGDVSYVGTCDASDPSGDGAAMNTVTLKVVSLEGDTGPLADWRDPCGPPQAPDGCQRSFACVENGDVAVTFDLTVMRAAQQGFFDVAVSFDDLFCSAKVDCLGADDGPLLLVHDASGARVASVVWALTCTDGDAGGSLATTTHLYMNALVLDCDGTEYPVEPWLGPGNVYPGGVGAPPPLVQAVVFRGVQQLASGAQTVDAVFWNVALGLDADFLAAQGAGAVCTLKTTATASRGPLDSGATPPGAVYPVIEVAVPITTGAGVTCTRHPLDGAAPHDGVASTYVGVDPSAPASARVAFDGVALQSAPGLVSAHLVDACAACAADASCDPVASPVCACLVGFYGDGESCTACGAVAHCTGQVSCSDGTDEVCDACASGYTLTGGACEDTDECALGAGTCDANATCTNTDGGYTCACDDGYTGDGQSCAAAVLTGAGTQASPRSWSDGTYAASCQGYRFPAAPYAYSGSTGSGVYTIDLGAGPFDVYCDMVGDGGGWTLVVNISNTTTAHGSTTTAYGTITTTTGAAKLSDATINALTTVGYWRYDCGSSFNAFVNNDQQTWVSQTTNGYNWRIDRGRDGVFENAANRAGYVFSDYPAQPVGHSNYAAVASSEGNGCYTATEGWNLNGHLWAK